MINDATNLLWAITAAVVVGAVLMLHVGERMARDRALATIGPHRVQVVTPALS